MLTPAHTLLGRQPGRTGPADLPPPSHSDEMVVPNGALGIAGEGGPGGGGGEWAGVSVSDGWGGKDGAGGGDVSGDEEEAGLKPAGGERHVLTAVGDA